MPKQFTPFFIFSFFAALFAGLYSMTPTPVVLTTSIYAAVLAFRMPEDLKPKDLFPLVMLFLFLLVLSQAPARLFTPSLIYAAQGLVLLRSLFVGLNQIQTTKGPVAKKELTFVLGLAIDFFIVAFLLYSTFKSVSAIFLLQALGIRAGVLLVASTWRTPLMIPGILLGVLYFVPQMHAASALTFSVLIIAYGIYRLRRHEPNLV